MTNLPDSIPLVTVTGWFVQAVADTATDVDHAPDMLPMAGSVILTPNVDRIKVIAAGMSPLTVFPMPIECSLDESGHLLGPDGTPDVEVIATGEFVQTYSILFQLDGIQRFSMTVALPAGDPVDLTTVIEVPAKPIADLASWQEVVAQVTSLRDQALAAADRAEAALAAMS